MTNFHTFGFVLAIVGMLASGAYIFFILKDKKDSPDYQHLPADESIEHKTYSIWSRILWVIFTVVVTAVIPLLAFARLMALCRRE